MNRIRKLLASGVVFSFLFANVVYPQQTARVQETLSNVGTQFESSTPRVGRLGSSLTQIGEDVNPYNISIPEKFGVVEEVFQG
ncbi:MAG TPA: hypothetical protein VJA00_01650, partial [Candidatus Omnitrophota bacterium]|nr:hypothetical protein [Candidatus Omnitrophota bacterium]